MKKTDTSPVKLLISFDRRDGTDRVDISPVYLSEEDGKPRNYSGWGWDDENKKHGENGIPLADLNIRGHWYQGSQEVGDWIGLDAEYYPYCVNLASAEKMFKGLKEIGKRIDKLNATLGYAVGLGQHVVRLGVALGVSGYLVYHTNRNSDYCDSTFCHFDASQILHYCDEETKKRQ